MGVILHDKDSAQRSVCAGLLMPLYSKPQDVQTSAFQMEAMLDFRFDIGPHSVLSGLHSNLINRKQIERL
jgi:hypothetical protein